MWLYGTGQGEMVEKAAGEVKVGTSRMYRTLWTLERVPNEIRRFLRLVSRDGI